MVYELRTEVQNRLNAKIIEDIRTSPKPTKVAEALAVVKAMKGVAVSLEEIAEIINIADPGRNVKAKPRDYDINELDKHPDLLLIRTPTQTLVRYSTGLRL